MMLRFKYLALIAFFLCLNAIGSSVTAQSGCGGQFPGGTVCANPAASLGLPGPTANLVLGVPGTNAGTLGFAGLSSGTATIAPQAAAGTPILTLPTVTGTFATNASGPLVLNTVTGNLTCPTCVTGTGGAITNGVTPTSGYTAGQLIVSNGTVVSAVTPAAGQILAGATPAFTATPVLGASGTLGSIGFGNATSGIVTLQPVAGALGTITVSIPSAAGTMAVSASAPLSLNATSGALTCATCVTGTSGALTAGTTSTSGYTSGQILGSNGSVLSVYSVNGSGNVVLTTSPSLVTPAIGVATGTSLALGGATIGSNALAITGTFAFSAGGSFGGAITGITTIATGAHTITSSSASAFAVGLNGSTNPAFAVNDSTALQAAGLIVNGAVTGGVVTLSAIDSGANTSISIVPKGTGNFSVVAGSSVVIANTGVIGAAPLNSGSGTDGSRFLSTGNNTVNWDFGFYQNGTMWSQPRLISNYATNFGTNFQPNGGNFGIGGRGSNYTPSFLLSLNGNVAETIGQERNTTAATAGNNLTVAAGGAIAGTNNLNGGNLILSSGVSTGTGTSQIALATYLKGTTGSTDNTLTIGLVLDENGHLLVKGASPIVSSCGSSPSIVGSDIGGAITAGSGVLSSCVYTFAKAWAVAPKCTISSPTAIASPTVTTSTTQITIGGTSLTSTVINYNCLSTG